MKLLIIIFLLLNIGLFSAEKEYPDYMEKEVSNFKTIHFIEFGEFARSICYNGIGNETIFIYHKKILVKKEFQGCFDHNVAFNKMSKELEAEYNKQLEEYWANQKKQKE